MRKLQFIQRLWQDQSNTTDRDRPSEDNLSNDLEENLQVIEGSLSKSPDLVIRRFTVRTSGLSAAALVYIDGLIDNAIINEHILRPLMLAADKESRKLNSKLEYIDQMLLTVGGLKTVETTVELLDAVLSGDTALLIEDEKSAFLISAKGWKKRGITEPDTEIVVKGPREGFTETLRTNTAMLRRKISHPSLVFESLKIGKKTRTDVCIGYLKGIVNDKLVEEMRRRLGRIDTDGILSSGFIEQYIEDAPFSPFATMAYTERPDVCAARLLEGRIAVFVDGSPLVNTVPMLFVEGFQSPDDYNFRPFYSTLVRWIRYLSFMIGILSPALYVALSSFHHELIPTPLLITMAAATEGTPFPAFFEALGMGIIFEILREAGIRLPRPIGQAMSIVGALVIGQTTVSAGLVGAPVVIVIALTAISSFAVPSQAEVGAILRLFLTVMAGLLGAYGIIAGLLIILIHLSALRSFGVPYLSPVAPLNMKDLKDVAVRAPLWAMLTRPRLIGWHDPVRQGFRLKPEPPDEDG